MNRLKSLWPEALLSMIVASSVLSVSASAAQISDPPVRFVIQGEVRGPVIGRDHPDAKENKHGFEGGYATKIEGVYHLIITEMDGDPFPENVKLAHWRSKDAVEWKRVATLFETHGTPGNRVIQWSPMAVFNKNTGCWELFYTIYQPRGDSHGAVWRAKSVVSGLQGIGGPYMKAEVVLEEGRESQEWEGIQGVDAFFPYQVKDRWYALYGSSKYGGPWLVGLAEAPSLHGPWKRMKFGNPIEPVFIESPFVIKIDNWYIAIYDSDLQKVERGYHQESHSVGYSWSDDGVHWATGSRIEVQPEGSHHWSADIRTPLSMVPEGDDVFTLLYTAYMRGATLMSPNPYGAVGMVRVKRVRLQR